MMQDIVLEAKEKPNAKKPAKENSFTYLMTAPVKPVKPRRAHEFTAEGVHVLDYGRVLRKITPEAGMTNLSLPSAVDGPVIDIAPVRGRPGYITVVVRGKDISGVALYDVTLNSTASSASFALVFPAASSSQVSPDQLSSSSPLPTQGVYATYADARWTSEGNTELFILMSDGSIVKAVVELCATVADENERTVGLAAAKTVEGAITRTDIKNDSSLAVNEVMSLSLDGQVIVAVSITRELIVISAQSLQELCRWTPDDDGAIVALRAVSGQVEDQVVRSHVISVWHADGVSSKLVLFHVIQNETGADAWRTHGAQLPNFPAKGAFEISSSGNLLVMVSSEKPVINTFLLSSCTDGCIFHGAYRIELDNKPIFGSIISTVAIMEKEGARLSLRTTTGLFIQDISNSDLSTTNTTAPKKTLESLITQNNKLQQETNRLRMENTALNSKRPCEIPADFDKQLKLTAKMVEETHNVIKTSHQEVRDRLSKLDRELSSAKAREQENIEKVTKKLEQAHGQVRNLVEEASEKDTQTICALLPHIDNKLMSVRQDFIAEYERLIQTMSWNHETETKRFSDSVISTIQDVLSEPGLSRLRSMVQSSFQPPEAGAYEKTIEKAIKSSLVGELEQHLKDTAEVFLTQERESLSNINSGFVKKAEKLISDFKLNLGELIKSQFEAVDGPSKWKDEIDELLKETLNQVSYTMTKISQTPVAKEADFCIATSIIRDSIENNTFWFDGVLFVNGIEVNSERIKIVEYLLSISKNPPPKPESDVDGSFRYSKFARNLTLIITTFDTGAYVKRALELTRRRSSFHTDICNHIDQILASDPKQNIPYLREIKQLAERDVFQ